jgi:DNA-binding NarL/FixJ family response regulator
VPASPTLARKGAGGSAGEGERPKGADLTPRELEVARLIAKGHSNREIAEALVITEKTTANHVQHVLDKLSVHSRTQIAAQAGELGLAEQ